MNGSLLSRISPVVMMPLTAAAIAVIGFWLLIHGFATALVATMALLVLMAVFYRSHETGIYLAITYLIFLGDIRRIWASFNGPVTYDLLVMIVPLFAALVAIPIFLRLRLHDTQSKFALGVTVMMILQTVNPAQGGIGVGLSGLLVTLPPLLWFWIGRTYGTEKMMRFIAHRIVVPAAVIACLVGLFQTFVGVPFWQEEWVRIQRQHSTTLMIGNGIRAFGFSNAASEYMSLILMASIFCTVGSMAGRRALLFFLPILIPTLFLASSRGRIFSLIIATALGYTFKSRNPATLPMRLLFALAVGFGGMALALSQHGDEAASNGQSSAASAEISHQVNGLAHPFDQRYSTSAAHQGEIVAGLFSALKHPIGYGTGTSYGAGQEVASSGEQVSSEFDISDSFINLGLPGGLLYTGFIVTMIMAGFRYTRFGPKDLSLPTFAMMLALLGTWLFPREYGNGATFFFFLGSVVKIVDAAGVKAGKVKPAQVPTGERTRAARDSAISAA